MILISSASGKSVCNEARMAVALKELTSPATVMVTLTTFLELAPGLNGEGGRGEGERGGGAGGEGELRAVCPVSRVHTS